MNGISIVCDINIIVYRLDGDQQIAELLQGREVKISVISELELLSKEGLSLADKSKLQSFLRQYTIVDISPTIKKRVVEIRHKVKAKLPDAIIAATAMDSNLPLLTADKRLEKILGLNAVIINR